MQIHLDDQVVSKLIRNLFSRFSTNVDHFLNGNTEFSKEIVDQSEFLLKLADTKLNTGHFNEVDENWRKLYSLICFCQSFMMFKQNKYEVCKLILLEFTISHLNFQIAIKIADKGLCMGRIDEDLVPIRQLAWLIHENLPGVSSDDWIHSSFQFNTTNTYPALIPLSNSKSIDECDEDDENSFEKLISAVQNNTPLIVRRHSSNMPAIEKWSFPFLLQELHSRTFPVEIGTKYSDENWSQKLMTFKEFIRNSEVRYSKIILKLSVHFRMNGSILHNIAFSIRFHT